MTTEIVVTDKQKQKAKKVEKKKSKSWWKGQHKTKHHPLYGMEREYDHSFAPAIGAEVYTQLHEWMTWAGSAEILGSFNYTEGREVKNAPHASGLIDYIHINLRASMGTGGVTVDALDVAEHTLKASRSANGQFHSHPDMDAYWSNTDLKDQGEGTRFQMMWRPKEGVCYYLVASTTPAIKMRRYRWFTDQDGERHVYYCDAWVMGPSGTLLDHRQHRTQNWNLYSKRGYGTAGYGYYGYYGNYYGFQEDDEDTVVYPFGDTSYRTKAAAPLVETAFLTPEEMLHEMENDIDFTGGIILEEESERFMNYIGRTWGNHIFNLPEALNNEDEEAPIQAILDSVNYAVYILSLRDMDWNEVFKSPETWDKVFEEWV